MRSFDAFGDALERQGFLRSHRNRRRDQGLGQCQRPTAGVTAEQADHAPVFPNAVPVVDRLVTDIQFRANGCPMLARSQQQQPGRPRSRVPPGMIDRQLLQGDGFALGQAQFLLHQSLPVRDLSINQKHFSNQFVGNT